jgi:RimJ/RimL family protein N-acetyltransferase
MMTIEPVTLTGSLVRLEPLRMAHADELFEASRDPDIWTHLTMRQPRSRTDMEQLIAADLRDQQVGERLPFALVSLQLGHVVGQTGYHNVLVHDYGLEIGVTWLAPAMQGTGVNTESKYLLLRHAFEVMRAIRVQFRTRTANVTSQRAIERLGAMKEGVLRNSFILPDGSSGDRIIYSLIEREWPAVKARLESVMATQERSVRNAR